jgi:hypothetical protein
MGFNYASAFTDVQEIDPYVLKEIAVTAIMNYRSEFVAAGHVVVGFVLSKQKVVLTSEGGVTREYSFEELGFKL